MFNLQFRIVVIFLLSFISISMNNRPSLFNKFEIITVEYYLRFQSSTIPRKGSEASTTSKGSSSGGGLHAWTKSLTRHSSRSHSNHKRSTSTASSTSCELGEEAAQVLTAPAEVFSPVVTSSQPTPIPKKNSVSNDCSDCVFKQLLLILL